MANHTNDSRQTYEELEQRIHELTAQLKSHENREYKSRLFSFIFGREENKHWTLSLYNAIHGTCYNELSSITINTIEDVVYMGMKNDLSILVSETVSLYKSMELYEQQSSYNPNMPVREFMYAGKLYDKFIHSSKLNQYGKTLLPLPLPKLVVFYNGENDTEDEVILRLSDAFKEEIRQNIRNRCYKNKEKLSETQLSNEVEKIFQEASPDIEVTVRMININYGHNKNILDACRPLSEYAWFIAQIRKNIASSDDSAPNKVETAIDRAIYEMPGDFEIKDFLISNRAEVKDMCLTEYNETETLELFRQEGLQEGLQAGRKEGLQVGRQETMLLNIRNLMDSTGWSADKIMDMLKIPSDQQKMLSLKLTKN